MRKARENFHSGKYFICFQHCEFSRREISFSTTSHRTQQLHMNANIGRENLITESIFHLQNSQFSSSSFYSEVAKRKTSQPVKKSSSSNDSGEDSDHDDTESSESQRIRSLRSVNLRRPSVMAAALKAHHYGSFYLRMGAVGKDFRFFV